MVSSANACSIDGAIGYGPARRRSGRRAWVMLIPVALALVGLGWLVGGPRGPRGGEPSRASGGVPAPEAPASFDSVLHVPFAPADPEPAPKLPVAVASATPESDGVVAGRARTNSASEACARHREQAEQALRRGHWARLEQLARRKACWPHVNQATGLRMEALFELERYHDCIDLGAKSQAKEIVQWTNNCRRALASR